jgi:hypothetical protein
MGHLPTWPLPFSVRQRLCDFAGTVVEIWTMNGFQTAAAQAVTPPGTDWTLGVHHYDLV